MRTRRQRYSAIYWHAIRSILLPATTSPSYSVSVDVAQRRWNSSMPPTRTRDAPPA
jgi:hypothetical protein